MKEIKRQKVLLLFVLFIASTLLLTSMVDAQPFSIRLEKDVLMSDIPKPPPSEVTFRLYKNETGHQLISEQTFPSGEWTADYDFTKYPPGQSMVRIKVDFTETQPLIGNKPPHLWAEMDFDGMPVGQREELRHEAWALFAEEADTVVVGGVTSSMIANDAVTTDKIVDGTVSSADAGFNYADSSSKGGPALDLDCTACVSLTELDFTPGDDGDWTVSGSNMYSAVSGNVGIGTTTPNDDLHVANHIRIGEDPGYSTVYGELIHDGGGTGFKINSNAGGGTWADTHLQTNGTTRIFIESRGNVGIGTTAPSTKLQIEGGTDASFSNGSGFLVIGNEASPNIVMDETEIIARNNGEPTALYLNREGGNVVVPVLEITGGSDLSEQFDIKGLKDDLMPAPGMVVIIDPESPGDLIVSSKSYDKRVAGIISGAGGVRPGMLMGQTGTKADGSNPVALTGRVYCWADASNSVIEPGDFLTTSDTPGHSMKATDRAKAHGTVLGKAMSTLKEGKGLVLVLVTLQ